MLIAFYLVGKLLPYILVGILTKFTLLLIKQDTSLYLTAPLALALSINR